MPDEQYDLDAPTDGQPDIAETVSSTLPPHAGSAFDRDKFLINQKRMAISEKYHVYDDQGEPVMFVHREAHHLRMIVAALCAAVSFLIVIAIGMILTAVIDDAVSQSSGGPLLILGVVVSVVVAVAAALVVGIALSAKRHIGFFKDESGAEELIKVYQDKKLQLINATYTLADADGNLLGWFRKNHLYNVFRKRWYCHDTDGELVCVAKEDSIVKAIMRRFLGSFYGLLRTNFVLLAPDETTKLGMFNRKLTLFDKYVLDMTFDHEQTLDRRIAVALAVLLDTGERR